MSDNQELSVFERHSPALAVIEGSRQNTGKQPYRAYELAEPGVRAVWITFEFQDAQQTRCRLAWNHLIEILSSGEETVSLIFTTATFTLQGENLGALLKRLDAEEVILLRRFNLAIHLPPAKGEPVVTSLHRLAFEEESAPLANSPREPQA